MIKSLKRKGPMPHNGYRAFDISLLKKNFPNYQLLNYKIGLKIREIYKA